ncbi:MAG: hypothetical protein OXG11_03385 [Chloroflexi bacterium]|nr:hypothetical protein [Chloroflexota bacterium]
MAERFLKDRHVVEGAGSPFMLTVARTNPQYRTSDWWKRNAAGIKSAPARATEHGSEVHFERSSSFSLPGLLLIKQPRLL